MAWGWTAVCEGCDYEWEQLREEDEPPQECPLCDSTDLVVVEKD